MQKLQNCDNRNGANQEITKSRRDYSAAVVFVCLLFIKKFFVCLAEFNGGRFAGIDGEFVARFGVDSVACVFTLNIESGKS